MINLLKETKEMLNKNNKLEKDVLWVGNEESSISWQEFVKISDIEYDNGLGSQNVASDLLVVGKEWWLERHEYDGSEWWEYKELPKKPVTNKFIINRVMIGDGWNSSLEECNTEEISY